MAFEAQASIPSFKMCAMSSSQPQVLLRYRDSQIIKQICLTANYGSETLPPLTRHRSDAQVYREVLMTAE
jgi:hypothetical protein